MPTFTTTPIHQAATVAMDTVITIQVATDQNEAQFRPALQRALKWFAIVEQACSRFDPNSELRQLLGRPGEPVQVSPVLFGSVRFAVHLAHATGGAFDPTVGRRLEQHGFNRHYVTGEVLTSQNADASASFRDIRFGTGRTITLRRPLVLDLGAVAKGLAIDLASCELLAFDNFCVEAGGDLFAAGHNAEGQPWLIGVQDPRDPDALATTLDISNRAVCTSGTYERRTADGAGHHLLDPRTGEPVAGLASVTVIAPTAMAADGLATAAFVLGLDAGRHFLEESDVAGVFITPSGEIHRTRTGG
jgi:thiamine biosynthesis lipoprotein